MSDQCIVYKTTSDKISYILVVFGSMKYKYRRRKKNHGGVYFLLFVSCSSLQYIITVSINVHHCSFSHHSAQTQQS